MNQNNIFKPSKDSVNNSLLSEEEFNKMYSQSINDPKSFWKEKGKIIDWIKPFSKINDVSYSLNDLHIKWFHDGTLNASYNCLDRHLKNKGDQTAIIWEGDNPNEKKNITYNQLHSEVCRFANALKTLGAKKGDRITIYLPMIPEAAIAMLACGRIGAVHSVVFGGFAANELASRIDDSKAKLIVSASCGYEPGRTVHYKPLVNKALELASLIRIVY